MSICPRCKRICSFRITKRDLSPNSECVFVDYECSECKHKATAEIDRHEMIETFRNTEQSKTTNLNENQG